jgi:cytochrome oxidase Cu insertion factor (SCO1/SenC/PrrC family)
MRQIAMLSVLLLGVLWAAAQNSSKPAQKASGAGSQTTVEGCLSSSAGKYTLTDQHGKTFGCGYFLATSFRHFTD